MKKLIIATLTFLALIVLWEIMSRLQSHLIFVLPQPTKILGTLFSHLDRFQLHALVTLKEMLTGFLLALCLAFPLAGVMLLWGSLNLVLQPLFIVIQCIPMFTLAPIMVIWFGWSYIAIVIPTALMIFFPLTISIYKGLLSTPSYLLDYFRINQATPWQTFFKLQLPWALPHICAGLRISAGIAGIGAIAGEWAGAQEGLGMLMLESRRGADLEMTFAALFCLIGMSLLLYGAMAVLEKILLTRKISFLFASSALFAALWLIPAGHSIQKQSRLILDWLPNPNHVPIYVGIDQGLFKKHGIDLALLKLQDPSDAIPYLVSNQADLAVSYMPSTLNAIAKGAPIKPVGILIKEPLNCFLFRKGEGIQKLSDLNNKVMGYSLDGTESHSLESLLRDANVMIKSKQNVSFDLISTLGTGQVDCVYGAYWNIEPHHLESLGVETAYFKLAQFGMPNYYELIFLAKEGGVYADPEFVKRLQAALQESIEWAKRHPNEAFEIYVRLNPDKGAKTIAWERRAWEATQKILADHQELDLVMWQNFHEWQLKNGLISGRVDIERVVGNSG